MLILVRYTLSLLILIASTFTYAADEWLRDDSRQANKVRHFLEQQNTLAEKYLSQQQSTQQLLLQQWQTLTPDKAAAPWSMRNGREWKFDYANDGYRLISRTLNSTEKPQLIYDFSNRQTQFNYYNIGRWTLNKSASKLLFSEDINGSEQYRAIVIDLATGESTLIAEHLESNVMWGNNDEIYLIEKDESNQRPYQIVRFSDINTKEKEILWTENNADWLLSFYVSSNTDYAFLQGNNDSSSEQYILNLNTGTKTLLRRREKNTEYYADIVNDELFIRANINKAFALYSSKLTDNLIPLIKRKKNHWRLFFQLNKSESFQQFYLYKAGIAALSKIQQDSFLTLLSYQGEIKKRIPLNTPGQAAWLSHNGDFNSNLMRIRSMSMTSPARWEEIDISTQKRTPLSQDIYPGYEQQQYQSEVLTISSGDVQVPITLAYRSDKLNKNSPIILYGYGAYGFSMKPYFMPQVTSLLDQGIIYAIAHVRGGGYRGEYWHQAGRGRNKKNSINDFINAAKALKNFQQGQHPIAALGSSAGGTLVAAAINQQPELFSAAVLKVPFVDVTNSMSDTSLALTAQQYQEWGNPNIAAEYEAMKNYDPYRNIHAAPYPPLLVQVGLHDQRVPYWEGAKFINKIQTLSSATGPYLLQTDLESGHSMDRRKSLQQQAKEYAFLLSHLNQALINKAQAWSHK